MTSDPTSHYIDANGLRHHVVEWAPDGEPEGTYWLCHGFMDFAHSWTRVATRLQTAGYRVLAHDWRGHGETGWIGPGGYYHFADYALDLEGLLPQLAPEKLHLVGHSMGATACGYFAGVRSDRLLTLTLIEGLGPPDIGADQAKNRMKSWFDSVARSRAKQVGREETGNIADVAEALKRMRVRNSQLEGDFGLFLAEKATKLMPDGKRAWRFDPLHRTISPIPFRKDQFMAFLGAITVPTLVVLGEKGYRLPKVDEDARREAIPEHSVLEIPGAGHMIPWFDAEVLVERMLAHSAG